MWLIGTTYKMTQAPSNYTSTVTHYILSTKQPISNQKNYQPHSRSKITCFTPSLLHRKTNVGQAR